MAAYDNVNLPGAPVAPSYAAPLLDFKPLSQLGEDYFKGTQEKRTMALQNAFKDGLPKNDDGSLNIGSMTDTLAKLGGAESAMPLINMSIAADQAKERAGAINGVGPQSQNLPAPAPRNVSSTGATNQPGSANDFTLNNFAARFGLTDDNPRGQQIIGTIAKRLGIDPTQTITDQSVKDNAARQFAAATNSQRMAQAQPQGQQTGQGPTSVQTQAITPQAPYPVPPGMDLATADKLTAAGNNILKVAAGQMLKDPQGGAEMKAAAEAKFKQAEAIRKYHTDMAEKLALADPALKGEQKYQEESAKKFGDRYEAIQKAGHEAAVELPQLKLLKNDMSNPKFYSGPAADINLQFKRWLSVLDPNNNADAATAQEAFKKGANNLLQSQIRSLAASGAGRILLAEVNTMKAGNISGENTDMTNRRLAETAVRVFERNAAIAEMASKYKNGRIDPGFDAQLREYEKANPMFTKQELADPRILGALTLQNPGDIAALRLKSGTPFRTPDGRVKYVP